jgi:hypothetical protein
MADGYLIRVATLHKPFVFAKCWCEASNSGAMGPGKKRVALSCQSIGDKTDPFLCREIDALQALTDTAERDQHIADIARAEVY